MHTSDIELQNKQKTSLGKDMQGLGQSYHDLGNGPVSLTRGLLGKLISEVLVWVFVPVRTKVQIFVLVRSVIPVYRYGTGTAISGTYPFSVEIFPT